jgi:hypothetical protein
MDLIGYVSSISQAVAFIDFGRKGFANRGKAEEGRISYEKGITDALSVFKEAQTTSDPQTIILAEYTFITQELQFCDKSDKDSISSLTKAIESFDDAFLALQAVDEDGYKTAEKTHPHNSKYRVKSFPMDSFHIACIGHRTRIRNMLKTPGIDLIEKTPTNNGTALAVWMK